MSGISYAKRAILKALRERGIATVSIAYDGEGDSGQIGDIDAFDAKKKPVSTDQAIRLTLYRGKEPSDYASLHEALDDFSWVLLGHYHAGFQDNVGGYGTIRIDVAKRSVILDHNDCFVDTHHIRTEV